MEQARLARRVLLGRLASQVPQGSLVQQVRQGRVARRVQLDWDQLARQVPPVRLAQPVQLVRQELQALLAIRVGQALQELHQIPGQRVPRAEPQRVLRDLLALPQIRGQLEILVKQGLLENRGFKEILEKWVLKETLGPRGLRAFRDLQQTRALLGQRVERGRLVLPVLPVQRDQRARRVLLVLLGQRVLTDLLGLRGRSELAQRVLLGQEVRQGP